MENEVNDLRRSVCRLRRNQRLLFGLLVAIGLPLLLAAGLQDKGPRKLEVVDDQGRVRARIETGKIVLLNAAGQEKAILTADEDNGNLVLWGQEKKRLEVFMDRQTPRVVLYSPAGNPTLVLPGN